MNASPNLEPDRDAMWRHITTLFGGDFEGAADGLVELAWTDAEPPHKLGHGQQFGTDELEQLVDRAFELNRRPCVNVYVGAALRKPDTPRNARAKDSHFLCAPFGWYDHDEDGARAAVEESKKRGVPATITVVTGRHPILRLHLYWRLVEACRDPMLMRALCVVARVNAIPARMTRNMDERARLQREIDEALAEVADRIAKLGSALRSGRDDSAADEEEDA